MTMEKKITVLKEYIHIDNGGYTFEMYAHDNGDADLGGKRGYFTDGLAISNSFFGYSENTMKLNHLSPDHLEQLAASFIKAANKIRWLNSSSKAKEQ